ncbi:MAG TPA: NAD(P)H-hydrate dehydratase [Mycobacteriales bacterium]|nr:NAD(P)H-hydrate dehydratase [Mycobacteriales bacterium]
MTPALLREWPLPEPDDDGDKHDRGTVVVVGGTTSTPGAVLLAGLAALRAGAGRLQVLTVEPTAVALGVAMPEAMVRGLATNADGELAPAATEQIRAAAEDAAALVIGPGLIDPSSVAALLAAVVPHLPTTAVVIDAIALVALAEQRTLLHALDGRCVLTPNAGEVAALLGWDPRDDVAAAAEVASTYGASVAVRAGVAAPDGRAWRNLSGGIGLGTSGSGDVLAGLVGGLLARGAEAPQAAVWGQYLHCAAGERLATRLGRLGFLARELLDEVAPAMAAVSPGSDPD